MSGSDRKPSPVSKPLSVPAEQKDSHPSDPKNETDQKNEPAEKEAPCCKESFEIYFEGLDVHGKFLGLPETIHSNQKYKAQMDIEGNHESIDGFKLKVRANMKGMDHDVQFKTTRSSDRQFVIDPIVFSMKGAWDVSYQWLDANNEIVDSCDCKINVSPEEIK